MIETISVTEIHHFIEILSSNPLQLRKRTVLRLAPVLKTIFHQSVISYTCSQSNSDGSVLRLKTEPSELDWLQVYDMTH